MVVSDARLPLLDNCSLLEVVTCSNTACTAGVQLGAAPEAGLRSQMILLKTREPQEPRGDEDLSTSYGITASLKLGLWLAL